MMKKQLIFISLVILNALLGVAQNNNAKFFVGSIISDSSSVMDKAIENLPVSEILKSDNKIEIRLISITSPEFATVSVISYNNEKWNSECFVFNSGKKQFDKRKSSQLNLDKVVSKLVANNIFSLPSGKSINTSKQFINLSTNEIIYESMGISHGITYFVEFKVGDKFRRYSYSSPAEFAKFYPHISEYKNMTEIVKLFNQLTVISKAK